MSYRREVLSAVGGFDAKVLYTGDSQLGATVSALGAVILCPDMIIIHPPRPLDLVDRVYWAQRLEGTRRLDLQILMKTILAVLLGKGAHRLRFSSKGANSSAER